MSFPNVVKILINGKVIPAARTLEDFTYAVTSTTAPSIILLFGDINELPALLTQARQYKKRILLHVDLIDGVAKDKLGISYLARLGVTGIITTKSQLARLANEMGMIVIQRIFLTDSEGLRTGIQTLRKFKPDAVEIMPAFVSGDIIREIIRDTRLPVIAGGLLGTREEIDEIINNGAVAVSTSRRELWSI
ncbi:glycerol-3-phosphate responsive antiterminator [Dendrosporobacter sp. 1207_IL3150]|uniref:glycerol-3-phosphate responsive antiterminator n=1 Tax=Dendrosporobacter sp. 1207_IL3150 TaxID=3084054 RepID=UPI002FD9ECDA